MYLPPPKKRKVLVLASWFPREDNFVQGCFIAEQVQALIEYENLDIRVVSLIPYHIGYTAIIPWGYRNQVYHQVLMSSITWKMWKNVSVMYIPYKCGPLIERPLQFYTAEYALAKADEIIWKDFKFDLVHAHTSYLDGRLGVYLSKKYKVPLVITEHTGPFTVLTKNPLIKFNTVTAINSASQLICVSKALAKQVNIHTKYDLQKITIVPNGYNNSIFYSEEKTKATNKIVRLLYVGALEPGKNPFMLINAFEIVKQKLDDITLTFIGDGSLKAELQQYIYNHQLESQVFLLGVQKREKVAEIMRRKCDIFIVPSNGETFGCVVLEALASGRPVISTKCGGPEEIIVNDSLGELCPINNPLKLADLILKVIDKLTLYDQKSISQYAYDNFRYQIIANQINNIYQSTV